MDGDLSEHQPKQERLRTRWTASLDKIFADLVVEQIQLGNRPNDVFDKKTWNLIRDEFNKQTDLNFNNNQLRKHLDVLRTRYCSVKSAFDQTDFVMDDSSCIAFDHWLWEDNGAQPKPETAKIKDCPIYEQLCTIFADTGADGKYAQSSHYDGINKSIGTEDREKFISCPDTGTPQAETPSPAKLAKGNAPSVQKSSKNKGERKRKHSDEAGPTSGQTNDQELNEAMAGAMLDMVAASKLRAAAISKQDNRFSLTNCVEALDEIELMEGIDSHLYFAALDLFEDPNLRETFISLKSNKVKLTWLQGKCGSASHL